MIGSGQKRVDALGKVTGRAMFADDYNATGQLYAAVKYAEYPHAEIVAIETEDAKKVPGVEAVLTHKDVPGANRFGLVPDIRILADDRTRYLGDVVAIAAADSAELARKCLEKVKISYRELPAVFDPEEAMRKDAPHIHDNDNIAARHKVRKGDVQKGFAAADFIIEKKFTTQAVEHAYIEPESALAEPDEQDGIRVTGSMQNFYTSHKVIAAALGLPLNKVQVIQSTMGGSFGGKDEAATLVAVRAALLARVTGRPVKLTNSREDSFIQSYKRHPYIMYYKWGCESNGEICAMEINIIADSGAYTSMSPFVTWRSVVQAAGPYHCENVKTDVCAVFTNNNFTGAMRGFGSPQVNFAIESMIDELAEKCGKSPLEIRLINGFENESTTATGQKLTHVVSLKEVIRKAAGQSQFEKKWRQYREAKQQEPVIKRGIGMSCAYRGVSLGAEGVDCASAIVYVQPDGSITLSSGIIDMGQGARTAMAQIVAEVLGVSMEKIRFLPPDSDRVADSGPTVASRGTIMGGGAAKAAAEQIRDTLIITAAEQFKLPAEEIVLTEDSVLRFDVTGSKKTLCSFDELVKNCYALGRPLYKTGVRHIAKTSWDEETGQGDAYFTYVYGANIAEVEVDTETGRVRVVSFLSAHDVGKAINRKMVEGQIFGGVAMGVGYATMEHFIQREGRAQTINFDEYYIPTASDMPEMKTLILENPDKFGPFGAKSIGEPALEMAAPAIANAIFNATGKRIYNLPANLEEVLLGHKLVRPGARGSAGKQS